MATNPFDYAERFNPGRRRRQERVTPPVLDPIDEEIRRMQREKAETTLQTSPPPDQTARVTRLSRETGLPAYEVEPRADMIERDLADRRFLDLADQHPAISRFAVSNPRAAAMARDDTESLGLLGGAWDILRNVPARFGAESLWSSGASLRWATDRVLDWGSLAFAASQYVLPGSAQALERDPFDRAREEMEGRRRERDQMRDVAASFAERGRGANEITEGVLRGGASFLPAMVGAGVAIATRNPNAGLATMVAPTFGGEMEEAGRQGMTGPGAFAYGAAQTIIEAGTERLPFEGLVQILTRRLPIGRAFAEQMVLEGFGEQIATHAQDYVSWAALPENNGRSIDDYLDARPGAAFATALATFGSTTAQTSAAVAANRTAGLIERGLRARQARREQDFFDDAAEAAESSKLRERDPEAFRALAREMGSAEVFISGDAIREYQQSDGYDQRSDPFARYDTDEAALAGGDVVIPIEDALTDLVGTPAWEAIKDDMRLSPGGMTPREAASFEEAMDAVIAEMSDAMAENSRQDRDAQSVREKLVDQVATMFGTSFTSPVARDYAEIAVTRAEARSARLGQELTGQGFQGLEVRQVMPEGIAEAVKADQLDLVINAMRKRGDIEIGEGSTLLEFIKARGGINDTGGDLRSMGMPARLIRDFDPAQGGFAGLTGAGDYGLDTTLRDAIEAGYFSELANLENEAGTSELDNQVLIDAIGEEIAGRPVYASTRIDPMRENADGLRFMLEEMGMSPDEMSDAEVRAAVDGMAERDAGEGFEQRPEVQRNGGAVLNPVAVSSDKIDLDAAKAALASMKSAEATLASGEQVIFNRARKGLFSSSDRYRPHLRNQIIANLEKVVSGAVSYADTVKDGRPAVHAVALIELNGESMAVRLILLKPDDQALRQYQVEGFELAAAPADNLRSKELGKRAPATAANPTVSETVENFKGRQLFQPAFHGSPHIFDRFSLDAIGTGEGAQAYGWGLYFAGRREIAEFYRNSLIQGTLKWGGEKISDEDAYQRLREAALNAGGEGLGYTATNIANEVADGVRVGDSIKDMLTFVRKSDWDGNVKAAWASALLLAQDNLTFEKGSGRLYEVEIPEDDEYLLWDKPLSEQPSVLQDQLLAALEGLKSDRANSLMADVVAGTITGQEYYRQLMLVAGTERGALESRLGDMVWGANDKTASLALHEAGIAGIKYLDGGSRSQGDGSFNYVVFDDSRVAIKAYEQEARGRILFDQNRRIIELFQGRNLSTPIHEMGHMWLEELRIDASLPDAPEQIVNDWQTVQRWFAQNGHPLDENGAIPTEAHELWARGIERYLMEGKAPSAGLQRIFETVRGWMVNIYKTVKALNSPITPEIREVFDRLLATDEEIAAAREKQSLDALFKDAADLMSDAEFKAYRAQVDDARADAHANLLDKTMRTILRREQERYRDARKAIAAEEAERIDKSPLFRAIAAMREQRISKRWIVEGLGVDTLDLLPVRVPPLWQDGGVDPNIIAELTGYSGGRDMIEALIGAERAHRQAKEGGDKRSMRVRAIEEATNAEFARRFGDPLNDGSIEREALAAVHSEKQGEIIASELRVLSRKTGKRPTPWRIARDWARGKVRAGLVSQEASPSAIQRYARNAAKAGRAAEQAMLAQDVDETFRQKQFQMMNNALLAEAKAALDEVESAVKRMDGIARARTRKSVDQGYLEQAQALLEAVDLRKRSQVGIERQGKWEAWAADRQAEGFDLVTPPSFETTIGKTNWSRLSVENLLALDEQVKQIIHLGRLKQELLTAKKNREIARVADEIQAAIHEQRPDIMKDWRHRNTLGHRLRSGMRELFAVHRKMASLARQIDGGRDGGPMVSAIILPMTDAYNWEAEQHAEANEKLAAIMKPFLGRTASGRNKMTSGDVFFSSVGHSFNLEERMMIVANMGNAGNLQRLVDGEQVEDGFRWAPAGLEAIKNSLTKEQMDAVQAIWDMFESYKPLIAAKERRVNGVEPEWVDPTPVKTVHGTYRGGYFPVKYDPARSTKAQQQADADEAKRQMQGAYTAATTRRSFVKARVDRVEQRPLRYSFSTVTSGISEVIHDLAFHEYLIDANRLMRHPKIGGEIRKRYGPEVLKQFTEGLEDVAVGNAPAANAWEGALNHVRFGATIAGLGWNLKTALLQPFGLTQSVVRVGPRWIARGLREWTTYPAELPRRVREKSTFMRERAHTMNREVNEISNRVKGQTASRAVMEASFFYMIVKMQMTVDLPTWWGAYEKAIASDETESNAVLLADQAVKDAQGGGQIGDLARIQRGGPLMKLWTNFYSFFSTTYNLTAESFGRTNFKRPGDVLAFMSDMVLLHTIPSMMGVVLATILSGGDDDDEDIAAKLAGEHISFTMGTMVGLREMTGLGQSVAEWMTGKDIREFDGAYGGPAGLRALQELDKLGKQAAQGEMDHALRKSAINTAGVLLHLPSGQINKSLDGAMALSEGETNDLLALVSGPPRD